MNKLKKLAIKKAKEYKEEAEYLHIFRAKQRRLHGKNFNESWLCVAIDYRISNLLFKKSVLKKLFKI